MTDQTTDTTDPRDPRELIDRTDQSWQDWVAAIEGIPDERLQEPMVGHWTGKDLLGHVAFWEDWVIGECQRIQAGAPATDEDMDPLNQRQVEESKARSVAEQKRYRDETHARLMAYLGTIPADEPTFAALVKALEWETYKHYDEHTGQARSWREAQGV
jgi:hypothetical protein